ncbi:MAG: ECF-type sigma factor [Myxococcota bacterium]
MKDHALGFSADGDVPLSYAQLREIAAGYLKRERPDHTLQATALVNEVYLKLRKSRSLQFRDKAHFIRSMSQLMRRVLVDHARERAAQKRGHRRERVTLSGLVEDRDRALEIIALNDALKSLHKKHPQLAQFVELRYFVGLTLEEVAELRGISRTNAVLIWRRARTWLHRELTPK